MVFVIVRISMMPKRSAIYWLAQPSFLKYPGLSARDGTTNCELGPPTPTFKPKNAPQTCPKASLLGVFSQLMLPFPKSF